MSETEKSGGTPERVARMTTEAIVNLGLAVVVCVVLIGYGMYTNWWVNTKVQTTLDHIKTTLDAGHERNNREWIDLRASRDKFFVKMEVLVQTIEKNVQEDRQWNQRTIDELKQLIRASRP